MNFALYYPTAPKGKEETMSDGLYRPYFHGELVAEYRKSIRRNNSRKLSINNVEAQKQVEQVKEEYIEPGISRLNRQIDCD
jgi:hypothetical protein